MATDPKTYTRRPYQVQALEVTDDNMADVIAWVERNGGAVPWRGRDATGAAAFSLYCRDGDWQESLSEVHVVAGLFVVQGPGGGFEVHKPDEFHYSYDEGGVAND